MVPTRAGPRHPHVAEQGDGSRAHRSGPLPRRHVGGRARGSHVRVAGPGRSRPPSPVSMRDGPARHGAGRIPRSALPRSRRGRPRGPRRERGDRARRELAGRSSSSASSHAPGSASRFATDARWWTVERCASATSGGPAATDRSATSGQYAFDRAPTSSSGTTAESPTTAGTGVRRLGAASSATCARGARPPQPADSPPPGAPAARKRTSPQWRTERLDGDYIPRSSSPGPRRAPSDTGASLTSTRVASGGMGGRRPPCSSRSVR